MASSPRPSAEEKGKGKADVSDETYKQEGITSESPVTINEVRKLRQEFQFRSHLIASSRSLSFLTAIGTTHMTMNPQ